MTTYVTATPALVDATVRLRVEAREEGYEDALNIDTYELDEAGLAAELAHWTLPAGVAWAGAGYRIGFDIATDGMRTITRPVTGLTIGQTYRLLAGATFASTGGGPFVTSSSLRFGILGLPLKPFYLNAAGQASGGGYADGDVGQTVFVFEWTATAPTHDLAFEVTSADQGAQLLVGALVVQTTPSARMVLETYAQPADDDLWTLYGALPVDVAREVVVDEAGPPGARGIGFSLTNLAPSAVATVPEDSLGQSLTMTGLTPGVTYTARVNLGTGRPGSTLAPPWMRVVVDGVEDGVSEPSWAGWHRVRFVAAATSHVLRAQIVNALSMATFDDVRLWVYYARVDLVDDLDDVRRIVGLTRSDANGARDVREVAGVRMEDGTLILTDHEPALVGSVTYTVATQRIDVPVPSSTTEVATAQTRLDLTGNRFTQVVTPRLSASSPIVEVYEADQASSGTAHDVIGRSDPLVTKGVLRTRRGRLTVWWPTYAAALAFTHLFDTGDEVLWRQDKFPGLDMYFIRSSVRTSPYQAHTATRRWSVEVDYVEVAFPTVPIAGDAAWNYREGALRNATYWDDLREFGTYADRLNGPAVTA